MKTCDKCGKEFKKGDETFTAIGLHICKECNEKSGGTISMDLFMEKMLNQKK